MRVTLRFRLVTSAARLRGVPAAAVVAAALVVAGAGPACRMRPSRAELTLEVHQLTELSRSLRTRTPAAPGTAREASEAQRRLLDRLVAVLAQIPRDARTDRALMRDLAGTYVPLAVIGDAGLDAETLATLETAAGYAEAMHIDEPDDTSLLILAMAIHRDRAAVLTSRDEARARNARAVHAALVEELEARHGTTPDVLAAVAAGYADAGRLLAAGGDLDGAGRFYERAVTRYRDELEQRERPEAGTASDPTRIAGTAWTRLRLAEALLARHAASRDGARAAWAEEARRLVASTTRMDETVPGPDESGPEYVALYDALTAALAQLPR